ncbi:hypothetical protein PITCH_A1280069 [uncultured Desulfobacterium sp.]|uniref:Uncharacterized protein n=1 Tax=uncultured Desulfobacterium sp. TaxID=201089 RepID=A0A445MSA4_9BACT|nr:hypothetical protein PITCH_A1280069 [uncultured Desulfobacterium sp.]
MYPPASMLSSTYGAYGMMNNTLNMANSAINSVGSSACGK